MSDNGRKSDSGNDDPPPSGKWKWLTLFLFLVALAIVLLLFVRCSAEAQESGDSLASDLVETSIANIRAAGILAEAKVLGKVEEFPDIFERMSADDEVFFYSDGDKNHILTIAEAAELSSDAGAFLENFKERVESLSADFGASENWVVEYTIEDRSPTYVVMTDNGLNSVGTLANLSRIHFESQFPKFQRTPGNKVLPDCAERVLTRNIFGQVAESVRVCVEAICNAGNPSPCEIVEKAKTEWFFGKVEFNPATQPEPGQTVGPLCKGRAYYTWSVEFLGLRIFGYDAEIPGLARANSGSLMSSVKCP